ncbi:MAG: twin-arginine translocase subunit TatC [Acidobacteriota bacterium]
MDQHSGGEPPQDPTQDTGSEPIHYPDDPEHGLDPHIEPVTPPALSQGRRAAPQPPPPPGEEDEDEGMLRMSFLEHLEELRARLIRILIGGGVAFLLSMVFAMPIWQFVLAPLTFATKQVHGDIIAITPMEMFTIIWMWTPLVAAIYIAAPWVIYQVWGFISPGLYPRERKWAAPFIIITAGLFVAGGAFAYYVAFRYALVFLLSIGQDSGVKATISIDSYFTLFVNVILGISILFELPVVVFFLTLLRITTPGFLLRNSRYAILGIVILAAVVTPTPDPVNLALFSIPMIVLFFLGVFASYLLVLHREGQSFPWKAFLIWVLSVLALIGAIVAMMVFQYGYKLVPYSPFLTK